ncbi:hypothetical protein ACFL1C_06350 [Pseudomonadota bacterium]|jgi:hypothetical protein
MKPLRIVATALLLILWNNAFGQEVRILNLDDGDLVNEKGFTVVAKAKGFSSTTELNVLIALQNERNGYEGAVLTTVTPNSCVTIQPTDSISVSFLSTGPLCKDMTHDFTMVAEVDAGGFISSDWLQVVAYIYNEDWSINEFHEIRVHVR